jgi:hypothetical protein
VAGAVEYNHENKNENEDGTALQQQRSMSLVSFSDPEAAVLSEATLSGRGDVVSTGTDVLDTVASEPENADGSGVGQALATCPTLPNANGESYTDAQLRALVKSTLRRAGISDTRPYHVKHATASALHASNVPFVRIAAFLRHSVGSLTFLKHYVSNDMGEGCAHSLTAAYAQSPKE